MRKQGRLRSLIFKGLEIFTDCNRYNLMNIRQLEQRLGEIQEIKSKNKDQELDLLFQRFQYLLKGQFYEGQECLGKTLYLLTEFGKYPNIGLKEYDSRLIDNLHKLNNQEIYYNMNYFLRYRTSRGNEYRSRFVTEVILRYLRKTKYYYKEYLQSRLDIRDLDTLSFREVIKQSIQRWFIHRQIDLNPRYEKYIEFNGIQKIVLLKSCFGNRYYRNSHFIFQLIEELYADILCQYQSQKELSSEQWSSMLPILNEQSIQSNESIKQLREFYQNYFILNSQDEVNIINLIEFYLIECRSKQESSRDKESRISEDLKKIDLQIFQQLLKQNLQDYLEQISSSKSESFSLDPELVVLFENQQLQELLNIQDLVKQYHHLLITATSNYLEDKIPNQTIQN